MHIGFIVSHYPHKAFKQDGGLGTSVFNLVNALNNKGVRVSVFVYGQKTDFTLTEENITMYSISHQKKSGMFSWYTNRKQLNKFINNIIKKDKIDLIEAPDWTGVTAFMEFDIPLIIRFHGSDAYFCKLDGRKQKIKNYLFEKSAIRRATAFIAPTTYAGEVTGEIFGLQAEKIKTIHYGLEVENFVNDAPETFSENTILYIGTIIRKKGVLELAQIFNKVIKTNPDAKLILIGSDAPDLKTGSSSTYKLVEDLFSKQAKKQANYLGKIPYAQVQEHMKNANVCTFPSFAETLGMVTIESMALQKPVVNTSIGWAQELIDDGINGYLVHPSDISLYASRIVELLNDKEKSIEMGKNARKKVENTFDISKTVDINIEYYNRFIKK